VRCNIQGGGIKGVFVVGCRFGALRSQDLVDLIFDLQ
jgi:hypothetical protein